MKRNGLIAILLAIAVIAALVAVLVVPKLLDRGSGSGDRAAESVERDDGSARPSMEPGGNVPPTSVPEVGDADLAAIVADAADQANAEAPVRIDAVTMMTGATSRGTRIRYRYDVSQPIVRQERRVLRDRLAATNRRNVCRDNSIREVVDAGATIEYAYYGPGGEFLFATPVWRC